MATSSTEAALREAEVRATERDDRLAPMTARVREIVEREITVDPTQPQWEWLQDYSRDEWLNLLYDDIGCTDSETEKACKAAMVEDAWREVEAL